MKFIYDNGVIMHVKIYKDVIRRRDVILPSDCLNTYINKFRAIQMNTYHFPDHFWPDLIIIIISYYSHKSSYFEKTFFQKMK